jgi:hypothetical protein
MALSHFSVSSVLSLEKLNTENTEKCGGQEDAFAEVNCCPTNPEQCRAGLSDTDFSLWGFVLARTKPRSPKYVDREIPPAALPGCDIIPAPEAPRRDAARPRIE